MTQKVIHEDNSRTALAAPDGKAVPSDRFPQYLAAIIATIGAFSMGICLSWTSPAIPLLMKPNSKIHITAEQGSWIGSLLTLGAFIGAIPAGSIASKVGPKRTLVFSVFPLFLSWILIAFCSTVYGLYIARFLAGISIGAISVATPTYIAELAEAKIRGTLGTLFQLQITLGLLFGYVLGGPIEDFIVLALIPAVVPVVYLIAIAFMPESPVYLIARGQSANARISLQWFRGEDYDIDDEIARMLDSVKGTSVNRVGISDLYKCKATARAMIIALGLMVFQQLSGVNAVIFYAGNIFEGAGTSLEPSTCAIIIGIVQVVATYISTLLIDRAGRRILLLVSSSVMSLCLITLATYFHFKAQQDVSEYGYVPVASVSIYMVVFSIGFGPIPWIMLGELFNPKVKGMASSICASFNWSLAFAITKLFQNMVDTLGRSATFGLFAAVCALGTVFVMFILPETKGKDINEIMILLGGRDVNLDDDNDDELVKMRANV